MNFDPVCADSNLLRLLNDLCRLASVGPGRCPQRQNVEVRIPSGRFTAPRGKLIRPVCTFIQASAAASTKSNMLHPI